MASKHHSASSQYYKGHLENLEKENKQLKQRLDKIERENRDLKKSIYDLTAKLIPPRFTVLFTIF